jgi:hypothetical protein
LNANFRQVGIAVVRAADDKLYVTEDFMAPRVPVSPTAAPSGPPSPQRPRPHPAGEARSKWRPYQRPPGRRPRCRAAF